VPSASNPIPASLRTRRPVEPSADAAGKAACDGRHRRYRRSGWKGWRYRERPGITTPRASFHIQEYARDHSMCQYFRTNYVLMPMRSGNTTFLHQSSTGLPPHEAVSALGLQVLGVRGGVWAE
jgi:hypothetical protein